MTLYYINYLPVNPSKSVEPFLRLTETNRQIAKKKCYCIVHTSMYMHLVKSYLYATVTLTLFIDFQKKVLTLD